MPPKTRTSKLVTQDVHDVKEDFGLPPVSRPIKTNLQRRHLLFFYYRLFITYTCQLYEGRSESDLLDGMLQTHKTAFNLNQKINAMKN